MQGDVVQARMHLSHLLAIARETGQRTPALFAILGYGSLASSTRQPVKAVSLLAAFEALLHQTGINLFTLGGPFEMIYRQYLKMAQAQLDQASFALAQQEGHQLTLEQALALAAENELADEHGAAR